MRREPLSDRTAKLLVRVDDEDVVPAVRATVAEFDGGAVDGTTRFGAVRVSLPEPAVDGFCDRLPDGVDAVETSGVTGIAGDAGEDR